MTEKDPLKPGDVIWTRTNTGNTAQGWIVQADGTLRPIISGAAK